MYKYAVSYMYSLSANLDQLLNGQKQAFYEYFFDVGHKYYATWKTLNKQINTSILL